MLSILRAVNQREKFEDGLSVVRGSVINDQTAGLRIHQASDVGGRRRVDTILGYRLYYPRSLSNAGT
jgi:hypothetical protein